MILENAYFLKSIAMAFNVLFQMTILTTTDTIVLAIGLVDNMQRSRLQNKHVQMIWNVAAFTTCHVMVIFGGYPVAMTLQVRPLTAHGPKVS